MVCLCKYSVCTFSTSVHTMNVYVFVSSVVWFVLILFFIHLLFYLYTVLCSSCLTIQSYIYYIKSILSCPQYVIIADSIYFFLLLVLYCSCFFSLSLSLSPSVFLFLPVVCIFALPQTKKRSSKVLCVIRA